MNLSTGDATKDSSTPKDVEPKVGNDDDDALKNLVIVLVVVLVFFLVLLLILVIYITTNKYCFKHSAYVTLENGMQKSGDSSIKTVQTV